VRKAVIAQAAFFTTVNAMTLTTAIVLVGGLGLRLKHHTSDRPKPLVEILGKPMLEWIIKWLRTYGVRNLVFGVAHDEQKIIEHFGNGEAFGVDIKYSNHSVDGGTAEGTRLAISRFVSDHTFLVMNGDELSNVNLHKLFKQHTRTKAISTIVVAPFRSPYGVIDIDSEMNITRFLEKPVLPSMYVNAGIYVFNQDILDYLPKKGEIERTAFPALAKERLLRAYLHRGFWRTIDTHKDLIEAERELKKSRFLR
jgi:mannose-1-phosphate guanylyltransferase